VLTPYPSVNFIPQLQSSRKFKNNGSAKLVVSWSSCDVVWVVQFVVVVVVVLVFTKVNLKQDEAEKNKTKQNKETKKQTARHGTRKNPGFVAATGVCPGFLAGIWHPTLKKKIVIMKLMGGNQSGYKRYPLSQEQLQPLQTGNGLIHYYESLLSLWNF